MTRDRAEGIDTRKGGRVNPSAIIISREFSPSATPPTPLDLAGMVSRAKSNGFYDADAGASRYLLGRVSFQHMCDYFDSVMACDEDVPKSVKEAHRLMTIDRKYQLILFEYIGLFELQFRSVYAREMSLRYGAFAHRNPKLFKRQDYFDGFLREYAVPLRRIAKGKPCRQKRHIAEYGDMPIWEAVEEIILGTLSKLYKNTRSAAVRDAVAKSFACERDVFESWTSCLTVVRNQIAHFGPLLGRKLAIQPKKMPEVEADNTNPFFVALMLMRMLRTNMHFEGEIDLLFSVQLCLNVHRIFSQNRRELKALGVPDDWEAIMTSPDVSGIGIAINPKDKSDDAAPRKTVLPLKGD